MNYLSKKANTLEPYTPGEQPQDKRYIKLNTNENPYPMSPLAYKAAVKALNSAALYPDPEATAIKQAVAKIEGVEADEVFAANGSDEVLAFAYQAFFDKDKEILFPDITYSFYPVYARMFDIPYRQIPLTENYEIDITPYKTPNGGILIANPNAPTGISLPLEAIRQLAEYNLGSAVVIVDEAYVAFGAESAVKLIKDYPNVLVVRTMSKSHSMAGLRVGYAIGQKHLIQGLNTVKNCINSYVVDRVATAAAAQSLLDTQHTQEVITKIINTREWVSERLKELGYKVLPSSANFIFITRGENAKACYEYLRQNGVLVRYFNKPRIDQFLRVSIGTDEQMTEFIRIIKAFSLENMGD